MYRKCLLDLCQIVSKADVLKTGSKQLGLMAQLDFRIPDWSFLNSTLCKRTGTLAGFADAQAGLLLCIQRQRASGERT